MDYNEKYLFLEEARQKDKKIQNDRSVDEKYFRFLKEKFLAIENKNLDVMDVLLKYDSALLATGDNRGRIIFISLLDSFLDAQIISRDDLAQMPLMDVTLMNQYRAEKYAFLKGDDLEFDRSGTIPLHQVDALVVMQKCDLYNKMRHSMTDNEKDIIEGKMPPGWTDQGLNDEYKAYIRILFDNNKDTLFFSKSNQILSKNGMNLQPFNMN